MIITEGKRTISIEAGRLPTSRIIINKFTGRGSESGAVRAIGQAVSIIQSEAFVATLMGGRRRESVWAPGLGWATLERDEGQAGDVMLVSAHAIKEKRVLSAQAKQYLRGDGTFYEEDAQVPFGIVDGIKVWACEYTQHRSPKGIDSTFMDVEANQRLLDALVAAPEVMRSLRGSGEFGRIKILHAKAIWW